MSSAARTPVFRLMLDSKDITTSFAKRLESLTLTDNRGFEADQLDIVLLDRDGKLDLPSRGAKLSLALGWLGAPLVEKGQYVVDEVEHSGAPDKLTLRARSADLRAGLSTKKERSWHRQTVGSIVRKIAREASLKPAIAPTLDSQAVAHIDQTAESDINLLSRLATLHGAIATVKAGRLLFIKAGAGQTASGAAIAQVHITRQHGDGHRFAIADRETYTAVRAYFQDTKGAKKGEVLIDKAGPVKANKKTRPSIESTKTLRHTYASKANAQRAAKAEWDRLQRGVATFSLTLAKGRPELFPEQPAAVSGWKPAIDGLPWIIGKATHKLDSSGFTTDLELEVRAEVVA
ncbi:phage late control D family protein [Chitinimonas sp. BJB300]|uniref:phage late control D family protein n=1 Tax=Chitinimonas sp. BJB300 TaxID=1559339 RepID=UPI000C10423A|nr:phage late control D family protein [Chitinimonas sp. BJB300]PHV10908.1 late control protein [Chitinimonas sp. BJB300]TSJ88195.1 phage late control D family protein [Chitinimonas sp. BJB300]